ncbi:MAG: transposase [Planctomycetes bacterium]|nr:transposase [Planctomycetota bacterium]
MKQGKGLRRHSSQEIVEAIKQLDAGRSVEEIARECGVREWTVYRWRKRYRGISQTEISRLKKLEAENAKLKRIVADQALDIASLKDVLSKKW